MWLDGVPVVPQQETVLANSTFVLPNNNRPETEKNADEEQRHELDNDVQRDLLTDDESANEVSFSAFCNVVLLLSRIIQTTDQTFRGHHLRYPTHN